MHISKLHINNLRLISKLQFTPHPHLNIFSGKNGAGKSTILEAIYLLVRSRSFRQSTTKSLIQIKEKQLKISATLNSNNGFIQHLELSKSVSTNQLTINGHHQYKLTSVAQSIPLGIITPNIHKIIEEGPRQRRRLLDWGVFHVEPNYANLIKDYKKILMQRNAALKGNNKTAHIWDQQLEIISDEINFRREKYIKFISIFVQDLLQIFFPNKKFQIIYRKGWDKNKAFRQALKDNIKNDVNRGYTTIGPHRADMVIKVNDGVSKDILSRGELKILSIIIVISNLILIKSHTNEIPILLCDDIFSELDENNLTLLMDIILKEKFQTLITTLENNQNYFTSNQGKMFHVEQGEIV